MSVVIVLLSKQDSTAPGLVREKKRHAILELLERIEVRGRRKDGTTVVVKLKPKLQAKVLGHQIKGEGDTLLDIKIQTGSARARFYTVFLSNKRLKVEPKLVYYLILITSFL